MTRTNRFCLALAIGAVCCASAGVQADPPSRQYRWIDGTKNNLSKPHWGRAGALLLRKSPVDYPGDGSGAVIISDTERANPRVVSNRLFDQEQSKPNDRNLSDFVWQWGQFLDHDISISHASDESDRGDILVTDPTDELFPFIPLTRSDFADGTGTPGAPRQQINSITAWIDASNVYGSDEETAASLRTFENGELKTSEGGLLLPVGDDGFFLAGDERANEQIGLVAMHTLFVREHNRLARRVRRFRPEYSDEIVYHLARKMVAAEMQIITYREFLPALLGSQAPNPRGGREYSDRVLPHIANDFSTASYRFGHSMLSPSILLVGQDNTIEEEVALRDAFFNPDFYKGDPGLINKVLKGLASQTAQEIDTQIVDDVRNFLFGAPGSGGLDLASLNIQRGRDHGICDYNTLREAYGLSRVTSFGQITRNTDVADALEELYGSVDNIDAWVGGLAEDHANPRQSVGPLLGAVLRNQFERLRVGDRFYYLRDPIMKAPVVRYALDVRDVSLSKIIYWNTRMRLQPNVFYIRTHPDYRVYSLEDRNWFRELTGMNREPLGDERERRLRDLHR